MENNSYSVAVLGAGNIGSAVITRLQELDTDIVDINVTKVLVSDISKDRAVDKSLLTEDIKDIVDDESIDLVIEVLGGVEPGKEYIKSLLSNGKAVITANKDIIADCGNELVQLAQENNTCLYFEAAVAAGIPVLKPLIESLRGEDLSRVTGIINGTSNYILTSMEEGSSYGDALITAQELGYAEPDPTNDVEGIDAMYKTMILSLICFGATPDKDNVHTEGISSVTKEDFKLSNPDEIIQEYIMNKLDFMNENKFAISNIINFYIGKPLFFLISLKSSKKSIELYLNNFFFSENIVKKCRKLVKIK